MVKNLITFVLLLVPAVILAKPQGTQPQLTVEPHVEIVDPAKPQVQQPQVQPVPNPAGPVTFPAAPPSNSSQSTIGNHVEERDVHDLPAKTNETDIAQPQTAQCTRIYLPVCGSDNKTYNSPCELQAAQKTDSTLTQQHDGPCQDDNATKIPA